MPISPHLHAIVKVSCSACMPAGVVVSYRHGEIPVGRRQPCQLAGICFALSPDTYLPRGLQHAVVVMSSSIAAAGLAFRLFSSAPLNTKFNDGELLKIYAKCKNGIPKKKICVLITSCIPVRSCLANASDCQKLLTMLLYFLFLGLIEWFNIRGSLVLVLVFRILLSLRWALVSNFRHLYLQT